MSPTRSRPSRRCEPANSGWRNRAPRSPRLTAYEACGSPCFDARLAQLLEAAARTLRVARTSLWRFDGGRAAIRCADLYIESARRHETGAVLFRRLPRPLTSPRWSASASSSPTPPSATRATLRDDRTTICAARYQRHARRAAAGARVVYDWRARAWSMSARPRAWTVDERNFTLSVANLVTAAIADEAREARSGVSPNARKSSGAPRKRPKPRRRRRASSSPT